MSTTDPRTYYDRPVIKAPVWTREVPWYFFAGGMAGASSMLAVAAEASGHDGLARSSRRVAAVGAVASPALLVMDLGVPSRFLNMLRVFRPTSPLNMGSWLLAAYVPAAVGTALLDQLDRLPGVRRLAGAGAATGALGMTTYTAVLLADTAVPVWHEARRELPFVFASSAGASAGAAAFASTRDGSSISRRLTVLSVALEQVAITSMERRLGALAHPYREGAAGRYAKAARVLSVGGAAVMALAARRRPAAVAGATLVVAGAVCERWAVFEAGFQSAASPADTVGPQRLRRAERHASDGAPAAH